MSKIRLTIGWACHDDLEGSFWTSSALRLYYLGDAKNCKDVQMLICDDTPKEVEGLKNLANLSHSKYIYCPKNKET